MGIRFRRRIRLAPGVHLNLSGSGVSLSAGPRGASITVGKNGVYRNIGIPGTGLYSREKIGTGRGRRTKSAAVSEHTLSVPVSVEIAEGGELLFKDGDGNPVEEWVAREARKQRAEDIRQLLQEKADEINQAIDKIRDIHLDTPPPDQTLRMEPVPFQIPKPHRPSLEPINWFTRWFQSKRRAEIQEGNERKLESYKKAIQAWAKLKELHDAKEKARLMEARVALRNDPRAMEEYLARHLEELQWPRETRASFELIDAGRVVVMDVDLPEIEDLPDKTTNAPKRAWKLTIRSISEKQKRVNYARHIHGVLFRLIGETFATLPSASRVVISGFSQRPSPKTGQIDDDYLLSVRVWRKDWEGINFRNLNAIDPVEALTSFELRRNMTKTGIIKAIEPFSAAVS